MHPRSTRSLVGLAAIALVALVAVLLTRAPRPVSLPQQGPEGPVWLFDFGPALTPPFEGFARVSGETRYEDGAERGYGWVDVEGELETGSFHDASLHWEGARNLNLVSRAGPDPLAATYATGPALFELDLPPGRYDVWILTGDWGLLEYIPHEAYRVLVEDSALDLPGLGEAEFFQRIETPGPDDTLTDAEAYDRYVAPRFRWEKLTVDVDDGRLSVQVLAPERSRSILAKLGYYPWSDIGYGPPQRFAGALNAMVVTLSDARSRTRIETIDMARQDDFQRGNPRLPPRPAQAAAESEVPDYRLLPLTPLDSLTVASDEGRQNLRFALRATPGEYAPLTFAIRAHREIGELSLSTEGLTSSSGSGIDSADIAIGGVRYIARRVRGDDAKSWQPEPSLIVPEQHYTLKPHIPKQFWLTVHVPDGATPGTYRGSVDITLESRAPAQVEVEVEVLPFRLLRPTHIATGLTYFVPIQHAYYDDGRFWGRIRADFEDMRRHNMTTVQLTGMGLENYDDLHRLFGIYRDTGFEQPIYLLEAFTAIEYVTRVYGYEAGTESFYQHYVAIFEALLEQARKREWPPIIINFGDEFTNNALEAFGSELARRLKSLPGIVTAADVNGYRELTLLAPHVSILAFNRGWSGPDGVNGDKKLVNAATVMRVRQAGADPWLVNVGRDRFSNGAYLWKMIRLGVGGKLEWIYTDHRAEPHNPFDGMGLGANPLALAGPSNTTLSSLAYERMRLGLDDLAYLYTLEELVKAAPQGLQRERARALLDRIDASIDDDYETYVGEAGGRWKQADHQSLRDRVIEAILSLR